MYFSYFRNRLSSYHILHRTKLKAHIKQEKKEVRVCFFGVLKKYNFSTVLNTGKLW